MADTNEKTTMSVAEMRGLLGLGKTDSYWLVHKKRFETVLVNGKMRIVIESFEKWYANQVKYQKVAGPPPGGELKAGSYSVNELAELLNVHPSVVYDLLKKKELPSFSVDHWMRIPKGAFEKWYAAQNRYRTAEDRERDRELEESSMTMPEAARLLGISRNEMYQILKKKKSRKFFRFVNIAGRKRVTKDSFEKWFVRQRSYIKAPPKEDAAPGTAHPKQKKAIKAEDIDLAKTSYSPQEAAVLLDLPARDVYDLIRSGELPADSFAGKYRILKEVISWRLAEEQEHTDDEEED